MAVAARLSDWGLTFVWTRPLPAHHSLAAPRSSHESVPSSPHLDRTRPTAGASIELHHGPTALNHGGHCTGPSRRPHLRLNEILTTPCLPLRHSQSRSLSISHDSTDHTPQPPSGGQVEAQMSFTAWVGDCSRTASRCAALRRLIAALLTSPLACCLENRPSTCRPLTSPPTGPYPTRGRCIDRDAITAQPLGSMAAMAQGLHVRFSAVRTSPQSPHQTLAASRISD